MKNTPATKKICSLKLDVALAMCKNTMLVAIKRMGYNGKMAGHGFRSLALGLLKEKLGYTHDVADRQLAHVPKAALTRRMTGHSSYLSELK